jgi:nucleoid DNA-binding protein
MKIEDLIVQHLYKNKEVTLQEIGTFKLSPDIIFPENEEKEFVMPQNAISFEYDAKATEDNELINYIVQHTNKIKSLASSDLESYIMLSKQFLNIGKNLLIEGLGTLVKTQQGNYEFIPAGFISPKTTIESVPLKEKLEEKISFRSQKKPTKSKKNLWVALFFIGVIIAIITAWFLLKSKKTPAKKEITTTQNVIDTPLHIEINTQLINETSFKVVVKEYPNYEAATNSINKFNSYGHKLIVYTTDSIIYKVAMLFDKPLTDTAAIKDSLRRYIFGGNPYIEIDKPL